MESKRKWLAAGIAAVIMLAAAGAGIAYAAAPDVPRGLKVLGITIGGKSKAEAAQALRTGLASRAEELAQPYPVRIADRATTIQPQDVGLALDIPATVDRAAGKSPLAVAFGGRGVEPVVAVDEKRLVGALKSTADQLGTPVQLPGIVYEGLTPKPIYGVPGTGLDLKKTADAVTESWLRAPEAVVSIEEISPASGAAEVDRLLAELAEPAVAAPVTVRTSAGNLSLSPQQIAASLVIDSDEFGKLTPHVDEAALRAALKIPLAAIEVQPRNAGVTGGRLMASTEGKVLDTAQLSQALMDVLPKRAAADRAVAGTLKPVAPQTSSADLAALGIQEKVSTFTTNFSGGYESPRTNNILTGAKKIDGAVVRPGETFSLNGFTGPRGYAEGYRDAPVIMDGKLSPGVGGGMSQLTTTLFNAAYYAGMADVEHQPHTIYFSTYPSVIEATIFYPSLDLKFRNDSGYGILIDTSWTENSITISLWSTKIYDSVTTEWGARRDYTQPENMTVPAGPACIAREGSPGFRQDAWRVFKKGGEEVKREKFSWRYDAEPRVTCA